LPALDLVTVTKVGDGDSFAVDIRAIRAAHVDEATVGWIDLYKKVNTGKEFVLTGQAEVGVLSSTDRERVVPLEDERAALMRPFHHAN
jgi:hypothetical protein